MGGRREDREAYRHMVWFFEFMHPRKRKRRLRKAS
jgi:hypothetical protein